MQEETKPLSKEEIESRNAKIKTLTEKRDAYQQSYRNLTDPSSYLKWLEDRLVMTSNALERRTATTNFMKQMGATQERIDEIYALENRNHKDAFLLMIENVTVQNPVSELLVTSLHKQILKDINDYNAGFYRQERAFILNSTTVLPNYVKVPYLMEELVDKYNRSTLEPISKAFEFHYRFVSIHSFSDGNGRTGRLLMNYSLMKDNFFPVIVRPEKRNEYLNSLASYQSPEADSVPYYDFMLGEMDMSFQTCMDQMTKMPRRVSTHGMPQRVFDEEKEHKKS